MDGFAIILSVVDLIFLRNTRLFFASAEVNFVLVWTVVSIIIEHYLQIHFLFYKNIFFVLKGVFVSLPG